MCFPYSFVDAYVIFTYCSRSGSLTWLLFFLRYQWMCSESAHLPQWSMWEPWGWLPVYMQSWLHGGWERPPVPRYQWVCHWQPPLWRRTGTILINFYYYHSNNFLHMIPVVAFSAEGCIVFSCSAGTHQAATSASVHQAPSSIQAPEFVLILMNARSMERRHVLVAPVSMWLAPTNVNVKRVPYWTPLEDIALVGIAISLY